MAQTLIDQYYKIVSKPTDQNIKSKTQRVVKIKKSDVQIKKVKNSRKRKRVPSKSQHLTTENRTELSQTCTAMQTSTVEIDLTDDFDPIDYVDAFLESEAEEENKSFSCTPSQNPKLLESFECRSPSLILGLRTSLKVRRSLTFSPKVPHVARELFPTKDGTDSKIEKDVMSLPCKNSQDLNTCEHGNISAAFEAKKSPKKFRRSSSFNRQTQNSPKKVFASKVRPDLIRGVIANLNQVKQGIIPPNNFDLRKIYSSNHFAPSYGPLNSKATIKYEESDIVCPMNKHATSLFTIIIDVLINPINCGYFNDQELDQIYSIMTLPRNAQVLLVTLLKRKHSWQRIKLYDCKEIAGDLEPYFKELISHGFCTTDISNEKVSTLLKLLLLNEVRDICKKFKVKVGNKSNMMADLIKLSEKTKAFFPGAISPSSALMNTLTVVLGDCAHLTMDTISLIERLHVLHDPTRDPKLKLADTLLMLTDLAWGNLEFPSLPEERYPIFRNRDHLCCYTEARCSLTEILDAIEKKKWETVRKIGRTAYNSLVMLQANEEGEMLDIPLHIKMFNPQYVWIKVLMKSLDAFKKSTETISEAVQFLQTLISQRNHAQSNRGRWYSELALIEMHHKKDLESSASLTMQALLHEDLTDVDVVNMLERAQKLVNRRNGISHHTSTQIQELIENKTNELPFLNAPSVTITGTLIRGRNPGAKAKWAVDNGANETEYMNVELRALRYYQKNGYPHGVHCEGSLPILLFTLLFWDEIYGMSIPGAFASPYQVAPLDLFTTQFYDNRKEQIENKLQFVKMLDRASLTEFLGTEFMKYKQYKSLMQSSVFETREHFEQVVYCLGPNGVAGICERLAINYNLWKAGFPDLFLWNPGDEQCKIVEVKGPGDSLSTKQKFWLHYLQELGIMAEVCIVKGESRKL